VAKGFPAFQGFGVIERAEPIAQHDARQGCSFPNYVFDIAVIDMSKDFETFPSTRSMVPRTRTGGSWAFAGGAATANKTPTIPRTRNTS